jgi:hypothetical protein
MSPEIIDFGRACIGAKEDSLCDLNLIPVVGSRLPSIKFASDTVIPLILRLLTKLEFDGLVETEYLKGSVVVRPGEKFYEDYELRKFERAKGEAN